MPAEGAGGGGRTLAGEEERGQAHAHTDDVGDHVPRVGEQGERPDGEADHDLEDEEAQEDREREHHAADALRARPGCAGLDPDLPVRMSVSDAHHHSLGSLAAIICIHSHI
ncbi:hypothetical protein RHCRD62_40168 [Rhodococcus sp. RD6.2]|nr:hypothetical protein RHCRD62_40168 [Rhodococcus sp. RD6.2]